jgi:hypothetical protein
MEKHILEALSSQGTAVCLIADLFHLLFMNYGVLAPCLFWLMFSALTQIQDKNSIISTLSS